MRQTRFDVIVVGGGSAGSMAAVAAARGGARTCLVERSGHLGGTCFELANVTPFHNNRGDQIVRGLPQELVDRVSRRGGANGGGHLPNPSGIGGSFTPLDPGVMKSVLFEMAGAAGVELWLHALVIDAIADGGTLKGIRIFNNSGPQELFAHAIIDATGDADVAVRAGAAFVQDTPEAALNATLLFRAAGVDSDAFIADARSAPHKIVLVADPYLRDVKKLDPAGVMRGVRTIYDCPYIYLAHVVRDYIPRRDWTEWQITGEDKADWGQLKPFGSQFSIMPMAHRSDIVTLNVTGMTFDATNGAALSQAEIEGQRQVNLALVVLRRYVPGFEQSFLHSVAPRVSVRASRRIVGVYMLTRADVESQARFPDAIARGSYPMSVQSTTQSNLRHHVFVGAGGDYDIPYRSLLPEKIDGLLVAGRCLSATREAAGSARMGAQCMAYGQAAGVAASIAARQRIQPREVPIESLRSALLDQAAVI